MSSSQTGDGGGGSSLDSGGSSLSPTSAISSPSSTDSGSSAASPSSSASSTQAPSLAQTICHDYTTNCTAVVLSANSPCSVGWQLGCSLPTNPELPAGLCGTCMCTDSNRNIIDPLMCDIINTYQTSRSSSSSSQPPSSTGAPPSGNTTPPGERHRSPHEAKNSDQIPLHRPITNCNLFTAPTPTSLHTDPGGERVGVAPLVGGLFAGFAVAIAMAAFVIVRKKRRVSTAKGGLPSSATPTGVFADSRPGKENTDAGIPIELDDPPSLLKMSHVDALYNSNRSASALSSKSVKSDASAAGRAALSSRPFVDASAVSSGAELVIFSVADAVVPRGIVGLDEKDVASDAGFPRLDETVKKKDPAYPAVKPDSVELDIADSLVTSGELVAEPSQDDRDAGNPNAWTSDQHWQWAQWQWAYQWHEWQISQRQWQEQQRAHFAAKEEERKKAIAAGRMASGSESLQLLKAKQPRQYKPSPLSRESRISFSTMASDASRSTSRRVSFESSLSAQFTSTMRAPSRQSSISSTMSSATGSLSMIATSPEWAAPTDLTRSGSAKTRKSFALSVSSSSSSNGGRSHRRSRSTNSTRSTKLQHSNSVNSQFTTTLVTSFDGDEGGPVSPLSGRSNSTPTTPTSAGGPSLGITTSSSSFICPIPGSDEPVAVISITSTTPDGNLVTTQTIALPRPPSPNVAAAAAVVSSGGGSMSDSVSHHSLSLPRFSMDSMTMEPLQAPPFGSQQLSPRASISPSDIASISNLPILASPVPVAGTLTSSGASQVQQPTVDDPSQMQYPVRRSHPLRLHHAFRQLQISHPHLNLVDEDDLPPSSSTVTSPLSPLADARRRLDEEDDELVIVVGQHVVVWRVYPDGFCEGYCVETRRAGFFPVRCLVGSRSSGSGSGWQLSSSTIVGNSAGGGGGVGGPRSGADVLAKFMTMSSVGSSSSTETFGSVDGLNRVESLMADDL
ncbi:hypothetical protein DFJ73DRAFT_820923 [Zopfochytrium polystomum]|nr:hypothetical protein DFJ73DRAFT_820923 [Zopfochytrium polystomum]